MSKSFKAVTYDIRKEAKKALKEWCKVQDEERDYITLNCLVGEIMPKTNNKAMSIKIGTRFESWVVEKLTLDKLDYLDCVCECGNTRSVNVYSLTSGKSKSCGCKSKDLSKITVDKKYV